MADLVVRVASSRAEVDLALDLRYRVFCGEQGVSPRSERDGRDEDGAVHLVALDEDRLVGTCRLIFGRGTVTLSRMAVESAARGRGAGTALLREAESQAHVASARKISLHAQVHAQPFYEDAGYTPRGPVFVEEGIDHVAMEKRVA